MPHFTDILSYIFMGIAAIGIFAGGLGYIIGKFKAGTKQETSDVVSSADQLVNFWKDQAEGYKVMMAEKDKSNDEKFQALNAEIGKIQGQLLEKEKQNKTYLEILQNRDPEMKMFMETMIKSANEQAAVNANVVKVLSDIHTLCQQEHDRDLHITADITKS